MTLSAIAEETFQHLGELASSERAHQEAGPLPIQYWHPTFGPSCLMIQR